MRKVIFLSLIFGSLLFLQACGDDGLVLSGVSEESDEIVIEYENEKTESKTGVVYLCGAVNTPGVYEIDEDTRLYEVVEKAGGLDEEADIDAINLAKALKDGESIRVPYYGENLSVSENKLVNINSADKEELCTIPGIGETRALSIIEYREQNGGFSSLEELMNIPGIKDATFKKIEGYVCVDS